MIKKRGASAVAGKDIDHLDFNPHNNRLSNLKIKSIRANRSRQPKRS